MVKEEKNYGKAITDAEAKRLLLQMAEYINRLCEENGMTLFMSGGTLIGAVRHKGFIPWDDDIDLYLSRPDYDKFQEIFLSSGNSGRYKLLTHEIEKSYLYPFAKLIDTNTVLVEKGGYSGTQMGLFIDIFPIDGLGNTVKEATRRMRKINKYVTLNLSLLVEPWRKNVSFFKNLGIAVLNKIARLYGAEKLHKKLYAIARSVTYEESALVGEIIDEVQKKRIMNKEQVFGGSVIMDFEDIKLKAPIGYDRFLTQFYGDYMKLPPEEKRVAVHGYDLYYNTENKEL